MRTLPTCVFTFVSFLACWLSGPSVANGQLAQVLNDYKHERLFQYAPGDPWTRSNLFNRHTKHHGFAYNCDGEECKRNSPYICWKTHHEDDLPHRTGWWQRLNQTVGDIKQRIADGSCTACAQTDPCQRCQQSSSCGGCCPCETSETNASNVLLADKTHPAKNYPIARNLFHLRRSPAAYAPNAIGPTSTAKAAEAFNATGKRVAAAGLESLDMRLK